MLITLVVIVGVVALMVRARRLRAARARGVEQANPVVVIGSIFVICAVIVGLALLIHR